MRRDKPSSKQSEPAILHGRQVAYDREMCIVICLRFLLGEDFRAICEKPPMPIPAMFLAWVQHHQEAREIHRCACNFLSDRKLAKELGAPWVVAVTDWAEEVRAKLERGWPVDYLDRKYIPPDWNTVYPSLGYPPVRSSEDMRSYNIIITDFTQMLEPRDVMELIWTKEAVDAVWKANRLAREKSGRRVESRYYQDLDIAQSREIKRRDNALRQIARWRDGLGGKARALPEKFLAEPALAKRCGVAQVLCRRRDRRHYRHGYGSRTAARSRGRGCRCFATGPPAGRARDGCTPARFRWRGRGSCTPVRSRWRKCGRYLGPGCGSCTPGRFLRQGSGSKRGCA